MPLPQKQEKRYTVEDYYDTPENVRLELIDGEFYDMAPPNRIHQKLVAFLTRRIGNHIEDKGGDCEVYPAPFGVQLSKDDDTVVEPDISVVCDKEKLTDRGCVGAPDWIIEIVLPSNTTHDYVKKLGLYLKAGVREYWIVDPASRMVTVYKHEKDRLEPLTYTFEDAVEVGIYEDFSIDFADISAQL